MDVGLTTLAVAILCISTADAQISNVTAGPNPLLVSNLRFPLWDQIKPEHIEPAIQQVLAEESASFSLLEQDLTRALKVNNVTFSKVFRPLTQIQLRLDSVTGQVGLLSVSAVCSHTALSSVRQLCTAQLTKMFIMCTHTLCMMGKLP